MGQKLTTPIQDGLNMLHTELMQQAGADYDIVTTTTLTYDMFLSYIAKLNEICAAFKDSTGCILIFAVKKGTDSTIFWKATVRVACVKFNLHNKQSESYRILNIRQFLQVFRRISYECSSGQSGQVSDGSCSAPPTVYPTTAASTLLNENLKKEDTSLEECVICLERKPEVILPCCHAYCLPCIEQWWEYCEVGINELCFVARQMNIRDKSCPVCREALTSTDDTWVLSDAPTDDEMTREIQKDLMNIASGPGSTSLK